MLEPQAAPETGVKGEAEWWFRRHPASVRTARRMLRYFLAIWDTPQYRDAAELVVSELVTNAVVHARVSPGREIHVRFEISPDGLRIEVSDADIHHLPRRRESGEAEESGRGLAVLDALAAEWGCEPRACGIGKTVWVHLRPESAPGAVPVGHDQRRCALRLPPEWAAAEDAED